MLAGASLEIDGWEEEEGREVLLYRKQIINYEKQTLESPLLITKHSTFCLEYCAAKRSDSTTDSQRPTVAYKTWKVLTLRAAQYS